MRTAVRRSSNFDSTTDRADASRSAIADGAMRTLPSASMRRHPKKGVAVVVRIHARRTSQGEQTSIVVDAHQCVFVADRAFALTLLLETHSLRVVSEQCKCAQLGRSVHVVQAPDERNVNAIVRPCGARDREH